MTEGKNRVGGIYAPPPRFLQFLILLVPFSLLYVLFRGNNVCVLFVCVRVCVLLLIQHFMLIGCLFQAEGSQADNFLLKAFCLFESRLSVEAHVLR